MKLIVVESPHGGECDDSLSYACEIIQHAEQRGEHVLASVMAEHHAAPELIGPDENDSMIRAAFIIGQRADYVVFYLDNGWTYQMQQALKHWQDLGKPVMCRWTEGGAFIDIGDQTAIDAILQVKNEGVAVKGQVFSAFESMCESLMQCSIREIDFVLGTQRGKTFKEEGVLSVFYEGINAEGPIPELPVFNFHDYLGQCEIAVLNSLLGVERADHYRRTGQLDHFVEPINPDSNVVSLADFNAKTTPTIAEVQAACDSGKHVPRFNLREKLDTIDPDRNMELVCECDLTSVTTFVYIEDSDSDNGDRLRCSNCGGLQPWEEENNPAPKNGTETMPQDDMPF